MSRMAMGRVVRMSIGGAVGGMLGFVLLEPTLRATEEKQFVGPGGMLSGDLPAILIERIQNVVVMGIVIGACIGVALIMAEEITSGRLARLLRMSFFGIIIGALCGLVGAFVGQIFYAVFTALQMIVIGRAIGWGFMGAAAGLCPGKVTRSPRRTMQGMIGGLIGGLLGGLAFDAIGQLSASGTNSRFVGFTLMGWMIGFAVGLVEEFGKEHWLTMLTGAKEGRSFIIARPNTILGRDELADIPLFGDINVQRQHAILSKTANGIIIAAAPGQVVSVNNQVIIQQPLNDGDIVHIGGHRLRFGSRRVALPSNSMPAPHGAEWQQNGMAHQSAAGTSPLSGAGMGVGLPQIPSDYGSDPSGSNFPSLSAPVQVPFSQNFTAQVPSPQILPTLPSSLEVSEGPNRGQTFALLDGAIFGRDTRCEIALTRDAQTSRQHARLMLCEAVDDVGNMRVVWIIEDGGSSNGLWINGERVATAILKAGDEIGMGQTILRVTE